MAKTISIVDDDQSILDVVQLLLEDEGFTVHTYSEPQRFISDMKESVPDIVIIDNTIGAVSGKDLSDQIKQLAHIPVLMMSASTEKITHPSIDAFIHKPFAMEALLDTIHRYIT